MAPRRRGVAARPKSQPIAPPRRNPRRHGPVAQLNESIAPLIIESPRRIRYSPPTAALPALEETPSLKTLAKDGRSVNHSIAQRLQALALAEYGIEEKIAAAQAGLYNATSVKRLRKKARERGFDPAASSILKEEYMADAGRSGRPRISTPTKEAQILAAGIYFSSSRGIFTNKFSKERP